VSLAVNPCGFPQYSRAEKNPAHAVKMLADYERKENRGS